MNPASTDPAERMELEAQIRSHGPWWHDIDFGHGLSTRAIAPQSFGMVENDYPYAFWKHLENVIPADLSGKSVLDIGCCEGFFSLQCAKRNARRIRSIDASAHRISNLTFACGRLGVTTIEPRVQSVYDLDPDEAFDFVLMLGVLYHLDDPFSVLQKIAKITDTLLLETTVFEDRKDSVMQWRRSLGFDDGWNPSIRCIEDMLREVGFLHPERIPRPDTDRVTYLCRR